MSKIISSIFILWMLLIFSSNSLTWSSYPYDTWRQIQMVFCISLIIYCFSTTKLSILHTKILNYLNITTILYLFLTINFAAPAKLSLLCLNVLLINTILYLSIQFQKNSVYKNLVLLYTLCLIPLLSTIRLILEKIFLISHTDPLVSKLWLGNFSNMRQFDDAVLPIFFIGLSIIPLLKNKYLKRLCILSMILIIVGNLDNGARAILLSIASALLISVIVYKNFKMFKYSWIILSVATIIHLVLIQITPSYPILRSSSSGRIEIWNQAINYWIDFPLLGTPNLNEYISVLHPHNYFLQLISDYGVMGFIIITYILFIYWHIWKNRHNLHPYLFAGAIAIACNAMLSGSMIYPHTQVLNFILLSWVLSHTIQTCKMNKSIKSANKLFITQGIIILSLITMQLPNLMTSQTTSKPSTLNSQSIFAPYWWQYGQTNILHSHNK